MHIFKLINRRERELLATWMHEATSAWVNEWFATDAPDIGIDVEVNDIDAGDLREASWHTIKTNNAAWIALHIGADAEPKLVDAISMGHARPSDATSMLIGTVLRDAYLDFANHCLRVLGVNTNQAVLIDDSIPAGAWMRGAGSALVHIRIGEIQCAMFVSADSLTWPKVPTERVRLVSLHEAVAPYACTVHAWVGEVDLELGVLSTLRVGDVVRLEQTIDQPLALTMAGAGANGRRIAQVFPGKQGQKIAVQIVH